MAYVCEKVTKDMIDLPAYILCFLGIIMDKLEFYGFIDGKPGKLDTAPPSVLVIPIVSKKYQYCYDGIELIEKTLKDLIVKWNIIRPWILMIRMVLRQKAILTNINFLGRNNITLGSVQQSSYFLQLKCD